MSESEENQSVTDTTKGLRKLIAISLTIAIISLALGLVFEVISGTLDPNATLSSIGLILIVISIAVLVWLFLLFLLYNGKIDSVASDNPVDSLSLLLSEIKKWRPFIVQWLIPVVLFILPVAYGVYSVFTGSKLEIKILAALTMTTSMLAVVFWLLVQYVVSTNEQIKNIETALDKQRDPLAKIIADTKQPQAVRHIAEVLYHNTIHAAKELINPNEDAIFHNEDKYYSELTKRLIEMNKRGYGAVYAVCCYKDWSAPVRQEWVKLNVEALKKNVTVCRVFMPYDGLENDIAVRNEEIRLQDSLGINVMEADKSILANSDIFNINHTKHFGFVIFENSRHDREVIFHHDPKGSKSISLKNRIVTSQFKKLYDDIVNHKGQKHDSFSAEAEEYLNSFANDVRYLRNHRMSDLQMLFVLWRFDTERDKIKDLINKKIDIEARDKYNYLTHVYGQIISRLPSGYKYEVITVPEIWCGENMGNNEFFNMSEKAQKNGAKVKRVFFVKRDMFEWKIPSSSTQEEVEYEMKVNEYKKQVKDCVNFFKGKKCSGDSSPTFYIANSNEIAKDLLKELPIAYIYNSKGNEWLRISCKELLEAEPKFSLQYFKKQENDENGNGKKEDKKVKKKSNQKKDENVNGEESKQEKDETRYIFENAFKEFHKKKLISVQDDYYKNNLTLEEMEQYLGTL